MTDTTDLRETAVRLFDAAVTAADPARALQQTLVHHPLPAPDTNGRLIVLAVGKAAPAMMTELLRHAEPAIALVVTHHENNQIVPRARILKTGHPVPDTFGAKAADEILRILSTTTAADRVVALISGGGSALLPAPVAGLTLVEKAMVNKHLLGAGLDITQMNLVRQHLSQLKGGGLLRHAAPAPVTGYLLSDVIGDDLRVIASGPTVGPVGTAQQAIALLQEYGLWDSLPPAARAALEQAPASGPLPTAQNHLIGSNRQSLQAMVRAAKGWDARIVSDCLTGDVAAAAAQVLQHLVSVARPTALLFGGETTVVLRGTGRGGRNQELALRVALGAPEISGRWVFLSGGTDGRDGPTDAAGGVVDAKTLARIRLLGGDVAALLDNNDSYGALQLAGDLLLTQATGTNVADVQVLLMVP